MSKKTTIIGLRHLPDDMAYDEIVLGVDGNLYRKGIVADTEKINQEALERGEEPDHSIWSQGERWVGLNQKKTDILPPEEREKEEAEMLGEDK